MSENRGMVEDFAAHSQSIAAADQLVIPTELSAEATTMLLGGRADGIGIVQHKIATALQGQGVSGGAADNLAGRWMESYIAAVGASGSPEESVAHAGRLMNATAARMAQAVGDAPPLTAEQRLMTALTQGKSVSDLMTGEAGGTPALNRALFDGVMEQLSRPSGSADPIAALSQALNGTPPERPAADLSTLSPTEKLAQALASGGAIDALGPAASTEFVSEFERALSSGADVASSMATATARSAHAEAQARTAEVETSAGDRLLTALASGQADAVPVAGGGNGKAFVGTLNDALAQGTTPDAALDASVKAQAGMAALTDGAATASTPGDALTAALASGRDVAETVKSFAAAAGVDPAMADQFGQALAGALSSGSNAAHALGAAHQNALTASSIVSGTTQGVKGDALTAALASGENVQSAVQALGDGPFGAALAQALADGKPMGQALAAARHAADTAQQNTRQTAVPMSAEDKALADLATPKAQDAPASDAAPEQVAEAANSKEAPAEAAGEKVSKDAAEDGQETDKGAEDGKEGTPQDGAAAENTEGGTEPPPDTAPAERADAAKSDVPASFAAAGAKADAWAAGAAAPGSPSSVTASGAPAVSGRPAAAADPSRAPGNVVQTVVSQIAVVPVDTRPPAPVAASDFDAAALAKILAITEGTAAPAGFTVFHLIEAMFRPGKADSTIIGLAVVANPGSSLGVWQFSVDGSDWQAVGAVGDSAALVLPGHALLRFLPTDEMSGTAPALGLRALNETWAGGFSGAGRILFALTETGGKSPVSADVLNLSLVVTPVNDAPIATGSAVTLAAIVEDAAAPEGASVSSLFGALFSDADEGVSGDSPFGTMAGIAIVGNAETAAQGAWQYWNGSGWSAVGTVSEGSALLVGADGKLRFLPSKDWSGTVPALTVRLVDGSGGAVQTGGHADLTRTGVGGTTPFSATTITLNSSVTPLNDAPVATGTAVTLGAILEDAANPTGVPVSSLFGALFSDAADTVADGSSANRLAGVAIVGNAATAGQGVWQYWTGSAWSAVGTVSEDSALLVGADALLRFLPAADWNGTTPALTVRLVDDSSGVVTTGARVSLASGVGLATPYSAGTIALTQTVTAVNDAPVASGSAVTLDAIAEDTATPAGATVASLLGGVFSDRTDAVSGGSSPDALAGIAIIGNAASAGQGIWQYWDGTGWQAVGTASERTALIVAAVDKLRFVPTADWNGTVPALTVRLVDGSGGALTTGTVVDLGATGVGGKTAYGAGTVELAQEVTPVNDAPEIETASPSLTAKDGVATAVTGVSVSDIDAGSTQVLVTLTAGHGTLSLDGGGTDAVITGNGTGTVTVRATVSTINSLLAATDGLRYTAVSYTGADTVTVLVDDLGGGGAGGALTATATIAVTVIPPNASPVLLDTDLSLSTMVEANAEPGAGTAGIAMSSLVGLNGAGAANVTDGDTGALTGIALVGTNEAHGRWWFSTDGGASWALVGTVNDTDAALLLRSTDRLYFQPNAAVPETVPDALTIRAWDRTTGTHGTKVAVTTGAGSAFSGETDTVTLHPAVLVSNGSFDDGLTGWLSTGGASVTTGGDGHRGSLTSAGGNTASQLESYLGLSAGSIAAAAGTNPAGGHAMKLGSTITVTGDTTLSFDWTFDFTDNASFPDFGFVSVNGVITLLAKATDASGTFHVVIPAHTTLSLGFGVSDANDTSVSPILTIDNIRLTSIDDGSTLLTMTGQSLSLQSTFEVTGLDMLGDSDADETAPASSDDMSPSIDGTNEPAAEASGSDLDAPASQDTGNASQTDEPGTTLQAGSTTSGDGGQSGSQTPDTTSTTMADLAQQQTASASPDTTEGSGAVQSLAAESTTPDFAAMLQAALGTPQTTPDPQEQAGTDASAWITDAHDPAAQPHHPDDSTVVHAST